MKLAETRLTVTRASVRLDGRTAAWLSWSGRLVTVEDLHGKAIGRLLPSGYAQGLPDDGSGLYDLYTAKHPHVHTPSDVIVGGNLTLEQAAALLIGGRD